MTEPLPATELASMYSSIKGCHGSHAAYQFIEFLTRLSYENPESIAMLHEAIALIGLPMLLPEEKRLAYFENRLRTAVTDPKADEEHRPTAR